MVVRIKWALGYALLHFFTLFYFAVLKNIMLAYWLTVNILRNILSSYNVLQVDELRRSSLPEVLLRKGALKICRKFTGEHPCRSVTSIKLLCNLLKSHVDTGVFRPPLPKKTYGWQLLLCFQGVEKRCIGNKWVNMILSKFFIKGGGAGRSLSTLSNALKNVLKFCQKLQ